MKAARIAFARKTDSKLVKVAPVKAQVGPSLELDSPDWTMLRNSRLFAFENFHR